MTFLPLICSVAPAHFYSSTYISNGLIASPLLVLTFPVTHCLLLFSPASSLIISFLYPPLPVETYTSPFLFSFSPSSVSSPTRSPMAPQTRTRWQGPHVHLHLCSKLHWTISKVTTLTLEERRYYANKVRGMLTYHPHFSAQRQGCLWNGYRFRFYTILLYFVALSSGPHNTIIFSNVLVVNDTVRPQTFLLRTTQSLDLMFDMKCLIFPFIFQ